MSLWHEPANRLQSATAPNQWGTKVFYYDGVGNRIEERTLMFETCCAARRRVGSQVSTPPGGALSTDVYRYGPFDRG